MVAFNQQITFIYTRDLIASAEFYARVLGLSLTLDQGMCRIYRVTATAYIGVCQRDDAPTQPDSVILTLVTDDVDGWHARLRDHNVTIEHPPAYNEQFHIYQFFARDPNGYLIEIQHFAHSFP